MDSRYLEEFKNKVELYHSSRIQQLFESPTRLVYAKTLQTIAGLTQTPIRAQARTFWNQGMTMLFPEDMSTFIFGFSFFEEGLTSMVLKYLKNGMTFFDVGAHFGYFTLLASEIVGDGGRVHSFEPSESTFDILGSNARRSNIRCEKLAVYSEPTYLKLRDYGVRFSGLNSVYDARADERTRRKLNPRQYSVEAVSIDQYVDRTSVRPDFVKVDAESSEHEILRGMEATLHYCRPIVSLEVGDMNIRGVVCSKGLVLHMISRGYQPLEYKGGEIREHTPLERYGYDNILFLPK